MGPVEEEEGFSPFQDPQIIPTLVAWAAKFLTRCDAQEPVRSFWKAFVYLLRVICFPSKQSVLVVFFFFFFLIVGDRKFSHNSILTFHLS